MVARQHMPCGSSQSAEFEVILQRFQVKKEYVAFLKVTSSFSFFTVETWSRLFDERPAAVYLSASSPLS